MTTIAYRDGVMASDTGESSGSVWVGSVDKIIKTGGLLVGASGCVDACETCLNFFTEGGKVEDFKNTLSGDFEAVVTDGKRLWHTENKMKMYGIRASFFAMGSGMKIALGAMAMGANAKEAVEVACQFDKNSRGPVRSVKI